MSYERGCYRVLLFLHNRITDNLYDQYFYQNPGVPGAFSGVAAPSFSSAPADVQRRNTPNQKPQ
jgi:hypothetical protein